MTASTSAPEARMAARSITLPPDGSGRERRTSSARIASSGGGAWSTLLTAGGCVASSTPDLCGKIMVVLLRLSGRRSGHNGQGAAAARPARRARFRGAPPLVAVSAVRVAEQDEHGLPEPSRLRGRDRSGRVVARACDEIAEDR